MIGIIVGILFVFVVLAFLASIPGPIWEGLWSIIVLAGLGYLFYLWASASPVAAFASLAGFILAVVIYAWARKKVLRGFEIMEEEGR